MGRRYTLAGENLTLGTGNVLAAFQPAAAGSAGSWIEVEKVTVSQNHNATSAQVRLALSSRNLSGTLTVTSQSPNPLVIGGPASGISGGTAPTTAAKSGINSSADSGGTYVDIDYCDPNNQGGYLWQPVPEHKIIVPAGSIFAARLLASPGDTAGWTVTVYLHEVF